MVSEGTKGGCLGWVRGPWGVVSGGRRPPAARRAEKMRARSARFFSYLKFEVSVCLSFKILDKGIRLGS